MTINLPFPNRYPSREPLKHACWAKPAFSAPFAFDRKNMFKHYAPATSGRPETFAPPHRKRAAPLQSSPLQNPRTIVPLSPIMPVAPFDPPVPNSSKSIIQCNSASNTDSKFKVPAQNEISFKFRADTACQTVNNEPKCRDHSYTAGEEAQVNNLIDFSLSIMYTFLSVRLYYDRDVIALPGYAKFFREVCREGRENADTLINYQRMRGGVIFLYPLNVPELQFSEVSVGSDVLVGLEGVVRARKHTISELENLQALAEEVGDSETSELVERFLSDQNDGLKEITDMVAQVNRVESRHEFLELDSELLSK